MSNEHMIHGFIPRIFRSGGSLEVALSGDDDLSQGERSSLKFTSGQGQSSKLFNKVQLMSNAVMGK